MEEHTCPICNRILGKKNISKHHLIPKSKGGKYSETISIHNICHQKIHSIFTEKELKTAYYTVEKLVKHEEIKRFIKWVSKKDPSYYTANKTANFKTQKWK